MKKPVIVDNDTGNEMPEHEELTGQEISTIVHDGEIATPVKQGEKRSHKATYAADKRNGGYLVRVVGPHANAFSGKIVPVVKRDDSESAEALERVVWSGIDTGTKENPGTGKPVALYKFTQRKNKDNDVEF